MLTDINYLTEIIKSSASSLGQTLVLVYLLIDATQDLHKLTNIEIIPGTSTQDTLSLSSSC